MNGSPFIKILKLILLKDKKFGENGRRNRGKTDIEDELFARNEVEFYSGGWKTFLDD